MDIGSTDSPEKSLRRVIRLARTLERQLQERRLSHKLFVGFGLLVRNRRLAQAILRLGISHAYEARLQLRSMIELHINFEWIRTGRGGSRALRFMRYEPLERLSVTDDIASIFSPDKAEVVRKRFARERAAARHLFRIRRSSSKRIWARSWASVPVLRDRFLEVIRKEGCDPSDPFLYGTYRWFSSAVHGGPMSISEALEISGSGARARRQPELKPKAHIQAAAAILLADVAQLAKDAHLIKRLDPELSLLVSALRRDRPTSAPPRRESRADR